MCQMSFCKVVEERRHVIQHLHLQSAFIKPGLPNWEHQPGAWANSMPRIVHLYKWSSGCNDMHIRLHMVTWFLLTTPYPHIVPDWGTKSKDPKPFQFSHTLQLFFSRRLFIHAKVLRDIFGPRIQGMEYRAGSHMFGYPKHGSTKTFQVYSEESDSLAHLSKYIATICYRFFEVAGRYCDWIISYDFLCYKCVVIAIEASYFIPESCTAWLEHARLITNNPTMSRFRLTHNAPDLCWRPCTWHFCLLLRRLVVKFWSKATGILHG